ncbi:MAG: 23S rRNA (adenine(2503)-C(2))-methyltransferase RlmN [Dehalococcoidales bacterium]
MAEVVYLTELDDTQLRELTVSLGEPEYRAKQLQHRVFQQFAISFEEMTDLPLPFRQKLSETVNICTLSPAEENVSSDGTVKTLFSLKDALTIESTLMSYLSPQGKTRYTVCLSTQVGCAVGCHFCATGRQGFKRNLTTGEIVDQVLYYARKLKEQEWEEVIKNEADRRLITNLVFMGMGEPLVNYDALWEAVETLNSPRGFGLGARNMVISTSGLVPQIKRLSQEKIQISLAVSLHSSIDSVRDRLVPINKKYPLAELIQACKDYIEATNRRVTFEYALFSGINDSLKDARSLAHLIRGMNCHVNLIMANRTENRDYYPPAYATVVEFENELKRLKINCTLRQKRGLDIDSGCGQLRSRRVSGQKTLKLN